VRNTKDKQDTQEKRYLNQSVLKNKNNGIINAQRKLLSSLRTFKYTILGRKNQGPTTKARNREEGRDQENTKRSLLEKPGKTVIQQWKMEITEKGQHDYRESPENRLQTRTTLATTTQESSLKFEARHQRYRATNQTTAQHTTTETEGRRTCGHKAIKTTRNKLAALKN
jgi:hypothetical protein